jgi:hypothetical protein
MNNKTKIMNTLMTATMVFFTAALLANPVVPPSIEIAPVGVEKKMKVVLKNLKEATSIQLTDRNGAILINEKTEDPSYAKLFNLQLLKAGLYTLNIQTGQKEIEQPIQITDISLEINPKQRKEFLSPMVTLDQKVVNVMMLNRRLTDVKVYLRDEAGHILYQEDLGSVIRIEKRLDVASLERGSYQLVISTPRKTYYEDFFMQ